MKSATTLAGLALLALTLPGVATAQSASDKITLHPSGFGQHSYASWKAQEGAQDSRGNKNQALYMQKNTTTEIFAAAIAVFNGVEGMSTEALGQLGFYYRTDTHCGAGAPRFNLTYQPAMAPPGQTQTVFFGCNSGMTPTGMALTGPNGTVYEERKTTGPFPPGTVVALSLVFDEGLPLGGFVYLDNIQVGSKVWTSATDNNN